jgi:hypothetical protein
VLTIVSGAAPGVEQGAIEAAVNLALHWQGWASRDHIAAVPAIYRAGLQPTSSADPGMVRRLNCQDADGALVFSTSMVLVGVPAFVDRVTEQMHRAFLHVTLNPAALASRLPDEVRDHIRNWIRSNELARVYVTGPSADDVPGIQGAVRDALIAVLEPFAIDEVRAVTRALGLIDPVDSDAPARTFSNPTEGLDGTQRHQLDASIHEAERDVRGSGAVHWQRDPGYQDEAVYSDIPCQYDGYDGIAEVRATTNRAEVTCADCRTFFALYPEPPAPGDQTA